MRHSNIDAAPLPASGTTGKTNRTKSGTLATAGVAGVLASACCIGPLVLVSIGLGSIAAGVAATFEPLRLVFTAIAVVALGFAGWKVDRRPGAASESATACAIAQADRPYRTVFWVVALVVLALITFPYYIALFQ